MTYGKCGAYFCYFNLTTLHPKTKIKGPGLPAVRLSLPQTSSVIPFENGSAYWRETRFVVFIRELSHVVSALFIFAMWKDSWRYRAQWRSRYSAAAVTLGNTTDARRPQPHTTSYICSTFVAVWIFTKPLSVGTRSRTGRNRIQLSRGHSILTSREFT